MTVPFSRLLVGAALTVSCVSALVAPSQAALRTFQFGANDTEFNNLPGQDLSRALDVDDFSFSGQVTFDDSLPPFRTDMLTDSSLSAYRLQSLTTIIGGQTISFPPTDPTAPQSSIVVFDGQGSPSTVGPDNFSFGGSSNFVNNGETFSIGLGFTFEALSQDVLVNSTSLLDALSDIDSFPFNDFPNLVVDIVIGDTNNLIGTVDVREVFFTEIDTPSQEVSEPETLALLIMGLMGLGVYARRRRRA